MVRQIVVGVLVSAVPLGASWALAGGEDCKDHQKVIVRKVVKDGEGEQNQAAEVIQLVGEEGKDGVVFIHDGDGPQDGRSEHRRVRVIAKPGDDADEANRGWLGVSIGDVPEALAAQLQTEGRGVIILNVINDSPADEAGLSAHDVILSINGQAVDANVGRAVELIKTSKPGDVIDVTVLRNGETKTSRVTLGSRADMAGPGFAWKFEGAPGAQIEDKVETRGRIMLRGPGGKWEMKDLGDIHDLKDLPAEVLKFVPKSGSRSITVQADGDNKQIKIKTSHDGNTLIVEQEDGGAIEVRRTDNGGQETVNTYATADELRQGDPEAFDLYEHANDVAVSHAQPGGMAVFNFNLDHDGEDFDFDVDFDFDADAVRGEVEEGLNAARESYTKSMEELHRILQDMHAQAGKGGGGIGHMFVQPLGKPRHSFEVRPDGTIEVKIRKGDSELVQLFRNEADLVRRNPELSEKYQDLMNVDDEE